ncbi:CBM20 domain-containing protein, partial [Okeania sp. SIO2B9]
RPMMEKWDCSTRLYQDLHLLSKLRRLNPAVSLGSHVEKYISADIYCYLRRYQDSRCLVAMNRTEHKVELSLEDTELKDGEYSCLVSDRQFVVKDGKILKLELGPKQGIVLSYIGNHVKGKMIVRAQLNGIATKIGETVVVTGDCPELGNWDLSKAYPLEYINQNTWFGEIPFNESAGRRIVYKYVLLRKNLPPLRENLVNRSWILADQGTVKWYDSWAY